jgi:uncharacterized membrane protein YphA (DoxX/SURF4 family)
MDPVIATTIRAALALLFAAAASHKLRAPAHFVATVRNYRLLPPLLAPATAALLVSAEVVAAVLLATGMGRPMGAAMAAGLFALYAMAVATNLLRGRRHIDCGCTAPGAARTIHAGLVWRNGVLVLVALALLAPEGVRPLGWLDVVTIAAAVAALVALYAALDRLLANAPAIARLRGVA